MTAQTEELAPEQGTTTSTERYPHFCETCYTDAIDRLTLFGYTIPGEGKKPPRFVPAMKDVNPVASAVIRSRSRAILRERLGSPETFRHPRHAGTIRTVRP